MICRSVFVLLLGCIYRSIAHPLPAQIVHHVPSAPACRDGQICYVTPQNCEKQRSCAISVSVENATISVYVSNYVETDYFALRTFENNQMRSLLVCVPSANQLFHGFTIRFPENPPLEETLRFSDFSSGSIEREKNGRRGLTCKFDDITGVPIDKNPSFAILTGEYKADLELNFNKAIPLFYVNTTRYNFTEGANNFESLSDNGVLPNFNELSDIKEKELIEVEQAAERENKMIDESIAKLDKELATTFMENIDHEPVTPDIEDGNSQTEQLSTDNWIPVDSYGKLLAKQGKLASKLFVVEKFAENTPVEPNDYKEKWLDDYDDDDNSAHVSGASALLVPAFIYVIFG